MDTIKHDECQACATASYKLQALVVQTMNSHSPAAINGHAFTHSPVHWPVHVSRTHCKRTFILGASVHSLAHTCQLGKLTHNNTTFGSMCNTPKAPGCERELTRQGASLHPVPCITCPPPCELNSLAIVVVHAHATHAAHTFANIHSPAKPTKTCSGDVGQHA